MEEGGDVCDVTYDLWWEGEKGNLKRDVSYTHTHAYTHTHTPEKGVHPLHC